MCHFGVGTETRVLCRRCYQNISRQKAALFNMRRSALTAGQEKNVLMRSRRKEERHEQDEEKDRHITVMNPLTLDFHVHVATTKNRPLHILVLSPSLQFL